VSASVCEFFWVLFSSCVCAIDVLFVVGLKWQAAVFL
jgi:hypothetical protein